ncbi:response regulator transcription factor [Gemmatimonadota bacterium]
MAEVKPRVFIVDDDQGVRESVRILMRSIGVESEAYPSADEFLERHDPDKPGCLVLDVRMPGMSGLELQERLTSLGSTLPVIFITAHGDVPMAVEAVRAGAMDFVQKPFRDQELIDRIQDAFAANSKIREKLRDLGRINERIASLTPREHEVMERVVEGSANKVIAIDLGLSQRTVEIHRARVMSKMEADSVSQLVQMVMRARE